jgi:hypothetical protein
MKTPEPTKADPDYYPRIKINRRWYLIVPEFYLHEGCAFECPHTLSGCKFVEANGGDYKDVPMFERHNCGDNSSIYVAPSKFPEYLARIAANKLEGKS